MRVRTVIGRALAKSSVASWPTALFVLGCAQVIGADFGDYTVSVEGGPGQSGGANGGSGRGGVESGGRSGGGGVVSSGGALAGGGGAISGGGFTNGGGGSNGGSPPTGGVSGRGGSGTGGLCIPFFCPGAGGAAGTGGSTGGAPDTGGVAGTGGVTSGTTPAGVVHCGPSDCNLSGGNVCCITVASSTTTYDCRVDQTGCTRVFTCDTSADCPPSESCCVDPTVAVSTLCVTGCGHPFNCAGPNDCAPGTSCCATVTTGSTLLNYDRTECVPAGSCGTNGYVLCNTTADCPSGKTCSASVLLPGGYMSCR